jgi:hypothetical protein
MKKISSKLFVALSGIMALGVSAPAVAQSANGSGSIKIVRSVFVRMCWRCAQRLAKGLCLRFPVIRELAGKISFFEVD